MPTRRQVLDRNQLLMERAEASAARQVAAAYNQARRELLAALLEGWVGPGTLTPAEATRLAQRLGLMGAIDARLHQLERETGEILRGVIIAGEERALEAVSREMALLPRGIVGELSPFTRINTQMVERFLPLALDEAQLATGALRLQLRRELQAGLLQGESFPHLVGRLMRTGAQGEGPPIFRNGQTSAERAARRTVIHAENAARQEFIAQARQDIPELKKQAIAAIQANTTDTCLRVHGQVVGIDEPFQLAGEPRFADEMMHSPFHWNCRTSVAAWHPRFESGGLNTANMQSSAQAELQRRGEATSARRAPEPVVVEPVVVEPVVETRAPVVEYPRFSSLDEAQSWAESNFSAWRDELDFQEESVLGAFKGGKSRDVNGHLRELNLEGVDPEYSNHLIRIMDAAFEHPEAVVDQDVTVWRGMHNDLIKDLQGDRPIESIEGLTIKDKGFTATSLSRDVAEVNYGTNGVVAEIRVPAGTRAAYLDLPGFHNYDYREYELLLNRESQFKIVSATKEGNVTRLILEVVP